MTDAPSPEQRSLLTQFAIGGFALVVGSAVLFAIVGAAADDTGAGDTGADAPAVATSAPDGGDAASPDPSATEGGATEGDATAAPTDEPTPAGETTAPTAAETTPAAPAIEPSSVSVQVLDAIRQGATADDIAARLRDAGYDVVAENNAVRTYDQTTVFYTGYNEAAARQIADEYGFPIVEQAPANLNQSVAIHLVVGRDQG